MDERTGERTGEPDTTDATAGAEAARARRGEGSEVARARADVEETRARMGETIDALQERLEPRHLAGEAADGLRQAGEATVGRAGQAASEAAGTARAAGRGLFARLKGLLPRRGARG